LRKNKYRVNDAEDRGSDVSEGNIRRQNFRRKERTMKNLIFIVAISLFLIMFTMSICSASQKPFSPKFAIGYGGQTGQLSAHGIIFLTWIEEHNNPLPLSFTIPDAVKSERVYLRIFTLKGHLIYEKHAATVPEMNSIVWDGNDQFGRNVCAGYYFFTIDASFNAIPLQSDSNNNRDFYFWDATANCMPVDSTWPWDMEAGDIDDDGDLDIVIGCQEISRAAQSRVLINNGAGVYTDETESRLPEMITYTNDIDLADVDKDGDLDLYLGLTGTAPDGFVDKIFMNDGSGYFQDETALRMPEVTVPTSNVHFSDIDGDDDPDLIVVYMPYEFVDTDIRIFLNDGEGIFSSSEAERIQLSKRNAFNVVTADVDDDHDADLIIASIGTGWIFTEGEWDSLSGQNAILINDGSGWFSDETESRLPYTLEDRTRKVNICDVNGDAAVDLYFVNFGSEQEREIGTNAILINDGHGYYLDESDTRLPWETYIWNNDVDFADVDLDGDVDLLLVNVIPEEYAYDGLLINTGTGIFVDESWLLPPVLDFSTSCVLSDVSGDHDPDIIIANALPAAGSLDGQDRLYLNMLFPDPCVIRGDVDSDGRIDISDVMLCVSIIIHDYDPQETEWMCADINGDGSVNALDVVLIVNEIVRGP
jgi:hypothetical protein